MMEKKANKFIVSLTTIPSRFKDIYKCIDSLLQQSKSPNKIIINIPLVYTIRFKNETISDKEIHEFKNYYDNKNNNTKIIINHCKIDYGPGTKLLGLLENYSKYIEKKNYFFILVDDDVIYERDFTEGFDNFIKTNERIKLPIVASFHVYNINNLRIGQGVDGFLIQTKLLKSFLNYYNLIKEDEYINYHDDMFISFYFHIREIIIQKIESNKIMYTKYNNSNSLLKIKGKYSRNNLNLKCYHLLNEFYKKGVFHNKL